MTWVKTAELATEGAVVLAVTAELVGAGGPDPCLEVRWGYLAEVTSWDAKRQPDEAMRTITRDVLRFPAGCHVLETWRDDSEQAVPVDRTTLASSRSFHVVVTCPGECEGQ